MKRWDAEDRMLMWASLHEPSAIKSDKADYKSYRRPCPGRQLDQPVEETLNENTKMEEKESVEDEKLISAWHYKARRRQHSKPEGKISWKESKRRKRNRRQKRKNNRGYQKAMSSLYPGQITKRRQLWSDGTNPEEIAYW